jgi:nicotinamide-nucleotide amidase
MRTKKTLEIVERLGQALVARGLYMGAAESCTGGLLCDALTNVSGSSDWFLGGVVAYANSAKTSLLGVNPGDIVKYGAVSEAVVRAMAEGVRRLMGCPVGVGVSGVAGPTGGTPDKPVGTVWVAWAYGAELQAELFHFTGDRLEIKSRSVEAALAGLLTRLG